MPSAGAVPTHEPVNGTPKPMNGHELLDRIRPVEHRLDSGLRLLVREDHASPVVAIVTHVQAGYFDEPDRLVGLLGAMDVVVNNHCSLLNPVMGDLKRLGVSMFASVGVTSSGKKHSTLSLKATTLNRSPLLRFFTT